MIESRFPEVSSKELFAAIFCGEVIVNEERIRDPKRLIRGDEKIEIERKKFVSRGGDKLLCALKEWGILVEGKIFLDAGCSTGGFTDCLLQCGAKHVFAVDVGYNQLDYSLRNDKRVTVYERTNIMELKQLDPPPHAAVVDLSFRSVEGAASHVLSLTREGWGIFLIKPQFEWRNPESSFKGVVKNPDQVAKIFQDTLKGLNSESVYAHEALLSPIAGRKGNTEILTLLKNDPNDDQSDLFKTVCSQILERFS